jgi:hypothetical protein
VAFSLVHLLRRGPEWDPAKPMEEQSGWAEHAAYMDDLTVKGFIIQDEADSADAIRATLATDPWSESHLLVDRIEAWTIRLDGRRGPATR